MAELAIIITAIIATVVGGLGFVFSIIDFFWTKHRTQVRGPEFVIPYIELVNDWGVKTDGTTYCVIKPLIQNIGDRMSYFRIINILFQLTKDYDYTSSEIEPLQWSSAFQAQQQVPKKFVIKVDPRAKDWVDGNILIFSDYTNHKGELNTIYWMFYITENREIILVVKGKTDSLFKKTIKKSKVRQGMHESIFYKEAEELIKKRTDRRLIEITKMVQKQGKEKNEENEVD